MTSIIFPTPPQAYSQQYMTQVLQAINLGVSNVVPRAVEHAAPIRGDASGSGSALGYSAAIVVSHDEVNVRDYGATGNGAANDTAAFLAARDTGRPVYIPPGTYRLEGNISTTTSGQGWRGVAGQSIIKPVGSFNIFTFTGGADRCQISDLYFDCALQTGGYCVYVSNADRFTFRDCKGGSPYNIFYAEKTNSCTLKNLWFNGARGQYMFHLYGSPSLRTDIVTFDNVTASSDPAVAAASRATGLMIDGNVQTVTTNGLYLVIPLRGVHTRNTASGTFPTETTGHGRLHNLQVDYPTVEAVRLETAWDYEVSIPYLANSLTDAGIYIGSQCVQGRMIGGFVNGHPKEGLICGGQDWHFSGVEFFVNSFSPATYGTYPGVRLTSTAKRCTFSGCHSGDREGVGAIASYGVQLDSGASKISWNGGYLGGNLQEAWRDNSGLADNFEVTAAGSQLSVVNSMLIGTASGYGATATPTLSSGTVVAGTVTDGGHHYLLAPSVYAFDPANTGSGFLGTGTISNGVVTGISVITPGSGYSAGTKIYFRPQTSSPIIRPYSAPSSNIHGTFASKGTGAIVLQTDAGISLVAAYVADSVNYLQVNPAASSGHPAILAQGAGTNLNIELRPKGTGVIDLAGPQDVSAGSIEGYLTVNVSGVPKKIPYYAVS